MKSILKITTVLFMLCSLETVNAQNTEEYAILTHSQDPKTSRITINIGEDVGTMVEYERTKEEPFYNPAGIIAEMNKLNAMGFELFATSVATGENVRFAVYSYVFVKKIE